MANPPTKPDNDFAFQLVNNSTRSTNFAIYNKLPAPSNSSAPQSANPIWFTPGNEGQGVGNRLTINFGDQLYAICGTIDNPLSPDSSVTILDSHKVRITFPGAPGTKLRLTTVNHDGTRPVFDTTVDLTTKHTGSFEIDCDSSVSKNHPIYIGTSAGDLKLATPTNPVRTLNSQLAEPGKHYFFAGETVYWIGAVDDPQAVVDPSKLFKVDFSHGPLKQAFSYNAQGGFDAVEWVDQ